MFQNFAYFEYRSLVNLNQKRNNNYKSQPSNKQRRFQTMREVVNILLHIPHFKLLILKIDDLKANRRENSNEKDHLLFQRVWKTCLGKWIW